MISFHFPHVLKLRESGNDEAKANLCLNSETSGVKYEREKKERKRHRGGMCLIAKAYYPSINHTDEQGANANVEINRSSKNSCFGFFFFFYLLSGLKNN